MPLCVSLLLLATAAIQTAGEPAVTYPSPVHPVAGDDYVNWSGWGYLGSAGRAMREPFAVPGDWTAVKSFSDAYADRQVLPWRIKVVVFRRVDIVETGADGTLRLRTGYLDNAELPRIKAIAARLKPLISFSTGGLIAPLLDFDVETEPLRIDVSPKRSTTIQAVSAYLGPRINGGSYEAEDKIFRGPYNSAIVLLPAPVEGQAEAVVNNTPVSVVPTGVAGDTDSTGELEKTLMVSWRNSVAARSKLLGLGGEGARGIFGDWPALTTLGDLPTDRLLELLDKKLETVVGNKSLDAITGHAFRSAGVEAALSPDPDHGQVLNYSETSTVRGGGLAMAVRSDGAPVIDPAQAPTFTFSVRSKSPDPVAIRFSGTEGKVAYAVLGRDAPPPVERQAGAPVEQELAFAPDGTWQTVTVDLHSLLAQAGIEKVVGVDITAPPNCLTASRLADGSVQYSFAAFTSGSAAATTALKPRTADAASADYYERAIAAHTAPLSPELKKLFRDSNSTVRFNAVQRYESTNDAGNEVALAEVAKGDYNVFAAGCAIDGLASIGSETALETLRRIMRVGITDASKGTAAVALARTGAMKNAADVIPLLDNPSVGTRLGAIQALVLINSPEASTIRMMFLHQTDPSIKLAVTATTDPKDTDRMKRYVLWSAVNEPSDAVRVLSDLKLTEATDAGLQSEGYKGVKDDSVGVRLGLLAAFLQRPSEDQRTTVRIAVADRSPRVRAAALRAFAALPKGATAAEIANVTTDRNPEVQLALLELSKKSGLTIPDEALAAMKASPDPRVRDAAGSS